MRRFLRVLALSFALAPVSPTGAQDRFVILTVAPPEVVTVDASTFGILGHIPLPGPPSALSLPGKGGVVYFLVNGATNAGGSLPKKPSEVVVFDTVSNRILRSIEVGWAASRIAITNDGRFLLSFRDRSPRRVFEGPPSVEVGLITLAKQSKLGRKPWAICAIDLATLQVAWREEVDKDYGNVIYSRGLQRLCLFDRERTVKIVNDAGTAATLELPPKKGRRVAGLSPSGLWLYVLEDGKDAVAKIERVNGRIFAVNVTTAALASTFPVENEPLRFEEALGDRVAVATRSGVVRTFTASDLTSVIQAGSRFRFACPFENDGVLHVAKDRLTLYNTPDDVPAWTIDLEDRLHGEPGAPLVRVPNSSLIALPVLGSSREGVSLDRVAFVDTRSGAAPESVPVGRRGRMMAKFVAEAFAEGAAGAFSSPSMWSGIGSDCCSFSWSGLVVDAAQVLARSMRAIGAVHPFLTFSPDGMFAYAVSLAGNDLTILRTADSSVVQKFGLGGEAQGVVALPNAPLVCAWSHRKLTWIDTRTNAIIASNKPCRGSFRGVQLEPARGWIVTFTDRCTEVWDGNTARRLSVLDTPGKPRLLLFGDA